MLLILGLDLSQDQDPYCTSVSWEQALVWCDLMQQCLFSNLIIIMFQQLYCTGIQPPLKDNSSLSLLPTLSLLLTF